MRQRSDPPASQGGLDESLNVFKCDTEGISAVNTDKYLKELTVSRSNSCILF